MTSKRVSRFAARAAVCEASCAGSCWRLRVQFSELSAPFSDCPCFHYCASSPHARTMRSQRPFLRETRGDSNVPGKGAQGPPSSWPGDPGFHRPAGPHRAVAPADRAPALPGPARSGPGAVADSAAVAAGRANRGRRGGGPSSLRGGLACGPRTLPATLFKLWVTCSSRTQSIQF